MSNLIFNIRFGTWFFQITNEWECSLEQGRYWSEVYSRALDIHDTKHKYSIGEIMRAETSEPKFGFYKLNFIPHIPAGIKLLFKKRTTA